MPLRRRPKSSVACARRDSFDCFDGLPIDFPQDGVELAEGFRGNRLQQRLAVGKMPVGRRLRDAELLRQRLEADGFRAALFRFGKGGLNQRVPEIPMVVGVDRLAG